MRKRATKLGFVNGKNNLIKRFPVKKHVEIYMNHDYIYGIQPVTLALQSHKRRPYNLFIKTEHGKEKDRFVD